MEKMVREEAEKVIENGIPKMVHFDLTGKEEGGMVCGGVATVYIEAIVPKSAVYILGAGHIGFYVARIAKMADFRVVVCDNRPEYANRERFPEADEIFAEEYDGLFKKLAVNPSSFIVIVTHGHTHDQMVLEWAVTTNARYIGMIGSRKKYARSSTISFPRDFPGMTLKNASILPSAWTSRRKFPVKSPSVSWPRSSGSVIARTGREARLLFGLREKAYCFPEPE